ncbi:Crp/Fnr family transcriptional regulator [bacterium]|nr:Crp/Fnr family transcriptional regulator [bacterium]
MKHLKTYFEKLQKRTFQKGDVLLHQDESGEEVYFVTDGYLKAYTIADDGDEKLISILGPGDVINLESVFFKGYAHRYYFEALTSGVIKIKDTKSLEQELTKDPDVLMGLVRYVMARNDELAQTLDNILQAKSDTKLVNYLALLVQRFGTEVRDGIITLPFPLSHAQLASMVGTTRETMTVQLRQLTKAGVIKPAKSGLFRNRLSGFEINLEKLREFTEV